MTTPTLQKHYLRLLRLWPTDALRGLTVQDSLRRRMTERLLPSSQQQPAITTTPPLSKANLADASADAANVDGNVAAAPVVADAAEERQLNALYSLLENRYSNMYPTSEKLLEPAFKPEYYAQLAAEMEAAPKRTWFGKKWLRWSKLVRFS